MSKLAELKQQVERLQAERDELRKALRDMRDLYVFSRGGNTNYNIVHQANKVLKDTEGGGGES